MRTEKCLCVHVCLCPYEIHVCTHARMYARMYVRVYVYAPVGRSLQIRMYVSTYVRVYMYEWTPQNRRGQWPRQQIPPSSRRTFVTTYVRDNLRSCVCV